MCRIGRVGGELHCQAGEGMARLKFSESERGIELETILVPAACRGQGVGTLLMQRLIHYAELLGKDIHLTARPLAGRANPERLERLVRFYQRLGFRETGRGVSVCHMMRPCQGHATARGGAT